MPRLTGRDGDYMYFSCPSWTTAGIEYELAIDVHAGTIECSCMDSTCRHKVDLVTAKNPRVCKHSRAVLRLARILE